MRLAEKYSVPSEAALLYDFLNSIDLRRYVEKGQQHVQADALATPVQLAAWMRGAGLLAKGETISAPDHRHTLELRAAIRSLLQAPPDSRAKARHCADRLNKLSELYPLVMRVTQAGNFELQPTRSVHRLGRILAELFMLAASRRLYRLKMCSSPECQWVFFDRSKPANRRWCSSLLCGNRQKTRNYRSRVKRGAIIP